MCIPTDPRKGHRHPDSADSNIKAQFEELGSSAIVGSPADLGKLIAEETEEWAEVIRAAKIKPE